jgi:hypothetical protein
MRAPTDRRPTTARGTRRFGVEPSTVATVLGLVAVLVAGSQSCSGALAGHATLERPLVSAH